MVPPLKELFTLKTLKSTLVALKSTIQAKQTYSYKKKLTKTKNFKTT